MAANSYGEIYLQIADGSSLFDVRLYDGASEMDYPQGAYGLTCPSCYEGGLLPLVGPLGEVDPTDGFHTYQVVLDAKDNSDRSDDEITYYTDGIVGQILQRQNLVPVHPGRAEMGVLRTGSSFDGTPTDIRHAIWRLETGQHPCTSGDDLCPLPPPPVSTGDYSGNGVVDAADYTMWQDTLGTTVVLAGAVADGDANGTIDDGDYTFWKDRFGEMIGSGTAATVPEPSSLMLISLVMIKLVVFRFGRRGTSGR